MQLGQDTGCWGDTCLLDSRKPKICRSLFCAGNVRIVVPRPGPVYVGDKRALQLQSGVNPRLLDV